MWVTGPALEFLETMASLYMSQFLNGPTHAAGHTLEPVFTGQGECDPKVTNLISVPLLWSDHRLIKCKLSVALLPLREAGTHYDGLPPTGYWILLASKMQCGGGDTGGTS